MRRTRGFSMERKKRSGDGSSSCPRWSFSPVQLYPIINAFYESFYNRNLLSLRPPRFVGWDNYTYLFRSRDFWLSVQNTAIFTLGTFVPLVVVSLILRGLASCPVSSALPLLPARTLWPAVLSSVVAALDLALNF